MLRTVVLLLALANALFFAWTQGWLAGAGGLRPHPEREPERLARQVHPEHIVVLPPGGAAGPEATPASAPQQHGACLEAGPFAAGAVASARAAVQSLQPALPPGSWQDVAVTRPGSWMVYMGRYPNREALAKKEEELKRTRVAFQPVDEPAEFTMGFSLGRHDTRDGAERALEQLGQRGVRSARVVELVAPATLHLLRVARADAALAERLSALRLPALGRGFAACAG
ncbi:hypothetical protein [Piscinibacter sp.]|uniref:hypothetical protein n=1 Tax=Piscinibacter sp. TaxID=1903157 RepID=UPI0039E39E4B